MSTRIWRATIVGGLALASVAGAGTTAVAHGGTTAATNGADQVAQATANEFVVLTTDGASVAAAQAAVQRAGGRVTQVNDDVGLLTVESTNSGFVAAVEADASVDGVARNRPIGEAPVTGALPRREVEKLTAEERASAKTTATAAAPVAGEPLADKQWDMQMIGATPTGSYAVNQGDDDVLVGIIDTGIDASHPDLAPNFNARLSRNFTTDIPLIDGDCALEPDQSCNDPADVDEGGHGSHVAGTVAAALNGVGVSGVAPGVQLVNLRAGQDSGFFFLQPTIDAITFAGRHGIDVVNMSFFTDPWLYNCANNPADSPAEQLEQRTIIKATQRAVNFAPRPRRHAGRRARQRPHRPRQPDDRHHQPGLPARHGEDPRRSTTAAWTCPPRPAGSSRQRARPEQDEGRLLQLRHRADRLLGPRRLLPRLARHAAVPEHREPRALVLAEERGRRGGQCRSDHGPAADP